MRKDNAKRADKIDIETKAQELEFTRQQGIGVSQFLATKSPLHDVVHPSLRQAVNLPFHKDNKSFLSHRNKVGAAGPRDILIEYFNTSKGTMAQLSKISQAIITNYGSLRQIAPDFQASGFNPVNLFRVLSCLFCIAGGNYEAVEKIYKDWLQG